MKSKKTFLLLIALLFSTTVWSQTNDIKIDSLKRVFKNQNGTKKLKTLSIMVEYYLDNDTDSTYVYNEKLFIEAKKQSNKKYIANYYNNFGLYYSAIKKYSKAVEETKKAIKIAILINDKTELANFYKDLAGIYYYNDKPKEAIEYLFKAYHLYDKMNNKNGIISSLNNLGSLYNYLEKHDKALEIYKEGLVMAKKYSYKDKYALFYNNIGGTLKSLKMIDSSFIYYKKALILFQKKGSSTDLSKVYFDLGNLYAFYIKNSDSATNYYNKALVFDKTKQLEQRIYSYMGRMYAQENDYELSYKYLHKSLKIAQKNNSWIEQQHSHFYLYKNFKKQGIWDSATYHLENFIDYQDSLNIRESQVSIENLQSKFENEKNQLVIEKLEIKQKKDKKIRLLLIITLLLSLITFGFTLRSFILRRKKNKLEKELLQTEKDKIELDLNHKTRELTSQALMMLHKNKLLEEILQSLSIIKNTGGETHKEILGLKRRLKKSMHSEKDWDLFRQYFEQINKDFFVKIKQLNPSITPAELKLAALIKLRFSIKESASLLSISEGSVKTSRYQLRKKLKLKRSDNIYDYLNAIV